MSSRRSTRRSGVGTGSGDAEMVDLENTTPAAVTPAKPAAGTPAKQKSKVIDENANTASLFLECEEEPLSAAQKDFHKEKLKDFNEQMKKLEELAKKGAQITNKGDGNVVFRTTSDSSPGGAVPPGAGGNPNAPAAPLAVQNKTGANNCRLLMDPRTGRVLGTINGTGNIQTNISNTGNVLQRGPNPSSVNRMPYPGTPTSRIQASAPNRPSPPRGMSPSPVRPQAARPQTSVKPAQVVDLTRSGPSGPSGATPVNQAKSKYPALLVHPKPQDGQNNFRRSELDQKVKSLLVLTPAKLTEWLIKEGLVPQEQSEHGQKLKLGMYSDAKKFPNSGGYVWLSDDARNKYVSVFKSSIFETIIQPPSVILKLIYHYVCQTSLNNVLTWVKVDNATVDTFFRHLRCICIASVQEEIVNLGGENKAIELGVISLGTTTTDGNRREVKVEVLGVLERGTGRMRLRATEPVAGSNQAERFARIFKPLPTWVRRDSKIIADFSVDRERLLNMGYTNVFQCSAGASSKRGDNTNAYIMEYLKRVVPRMFQNSLSVLSTNVIQQFLDELTFREVFGKGPLQAFDGIISRIATQTSYVCKRNASMSTRIRTIGDNPFGDWRMTFSSAPVMSDD